MTKSIKRVLFRPLKNVLHTKSYYEQAAKISEGFHKCTGVKGAADKIEQMCK